MNYIRKIKYCHVKWKRKTRRLYLDDKGVTRTLEYSKQALAHEQRESIQRGNRSIYG